jgi:Ca2+-binding EF-hand superfamily protein
MKTLDADGDGQLSPQELAKGLTAAGSSPEEAAAMAKAMDKDGDGKVSPEELAAASAGGGGGGAAPVQKLGDPAAALKALDADGDGKLSPEELTKGLTAAGATPEEAAAAAKAMDKDGDGKVSPEELAAANAAAAAAGGTGGPGGPGGPLDKDGDGHVSPQEAALAKDKDGDGKISPAEAMAPNTLPNGEPQITVPEFMKRALAGPPPASPQDAYKKMDKDGDSKVTPEEFEAACAAMAPPISPAQAKDLFSKMDKDMSKGITPDEFFEGSAAAGTLPNGEPALSAPEMMKRAQKAFGSPKEAMAKLDKDGDGKISPEELAAGGASMTPPISAEQAKDLLPKLDKDGDGKISPEELDAAASDPGAGSGDPSGGVAADSPSPPRRGRDSAERREQGLDARLPEAREGRLWQPQGGICGYGQGRGRPGHARGDANDLRPTEAADHPRAGRRPLP